MKEYKAGEKITLEVQGASDGWLQLCNEDCFFFKIRQSLGTCNRLCSEHYRSDGKNVIFKETKGMTEEEFQKYIRLLETQAFKYSRSKDFGDDQGIVEQSYKLGALFMLRILRNIK